MPADNVDIFITAGGKSSRMGQDKGLVHIAGKPMILHIADTLKAQHHIFKVIANSDEYKKLGLNVVPDIVCEKGPMGALYAAYYYSQNEYVMILGCDTPFIPYSALLRLINNTNTNSITVAGIHSKINPLLAVYPAYYRQEVKRRIEKNNLKMQDFIDHSNYRVIEMDDILQKFPDGFFNFNEKKDLEQWSNMQTHQKLK